MIWWSVSACGTGPWRVSHFRAIRAGMLMEFTSAIGPACPAGAGGILGPLLGDGASRMPPLWGLDQFRQLWALRGNMSGTAQEGVSIKHDISVPVARIPTLVEEAGKAVAGLVPAARIACFRAYGRRPCIIISRPRVTWPAFAARRGEKSVSRYVRAGARSPPNTELAR